MSDPANMNVLMLLRMSASEILWDGGKSLAIFDFTAPPKKIQVSKGESTKDEDRDERRRDSRSFPGYVSFLFSPCRILDFLS